MKLEFKRFGLEKYGTITALLEILGALGLLVGLVFKPILFISSGGLALLMLFGLIVRVRVKDNFRLLLPALLFMVLNGYIFFDTINKILS